MEQNLIKGLFLLERITEVIIDKIIDLGVNEISLKWEYYNEELVARLRRKNIKTYAEVSLFVHQDMWQKYPESRPVDRAGNLMEPINWYYGVCPNNPEVQDEKLKTIDRIIKSLHVDGLWLDFIRYPCHWEEVRTSQITEYCFCKNCLEKYDKEVGGSPEGSDWITWKCEQITGFVKKVRKRIMNSGKPIQLGMFTVPWVGNTYGGAIQSIVCQDFQALSKYIDVFGAMTYHKLTSQPVHWIGDIVETIDRITDKSVVPLVQSMDIPETIPENEFEHSIEVAIRAPSKGVIVFHADDLLMNATKCEIVKQIFHRGCHTFPR
jgi:hypothetical protein